MITKPTIEILKNFCSINKSLVIKPGNRLSTLSINKNILAYADVEEQFDSQMSIYDLSTFLGGLSLFEKPSIDTSKDNYVTVSVMLQDVLKLDSSMPILILLHNLQRRKLLFLVRMLVSILMLMFFSNFNVLLQYINYQTYVFMVTVK